MKKTPKQPHVCRESRSCHCSIVGLEPAEDCPIHSFGTSRQTCACGRFVKRAKQLIEEVP